MIKGICHLACIPLRHEASSKSEMVSQLLMGETYSVMEEVASWFRIRMDWDGYEGWINETQFFLMETPLPLRLITSSPITFVIDSGNRVISMGSELYAEPGLFKLRHEEIPVEISAQNTILDPIYLAKSLLGTPYLWGGRTFMGIDCSGLIQVVAKATNRAIHRDAKDQFLLGEEVLGTENTKPGDLAFFSNDLGQVVHVGMLLSSKEIIHAHGHVRMDAFDAVGISRNGVYSHQLCGIRRIF